MKKANKQNKLFSKIFSGVLILSMIFMLLPVSAMAGEASQSKPEVVSAEPANPPENVALPAVPDDASISEPPAASSPDASIHAPEDEALLDDTSIRAPQDAALPDTSVSETEEVSSTASAASEPPESLVQAEPASEPEKVPAASQPASKSVPVRAARSLGTPTVHSYTGVYDGQPHAVAVENADEFEVGYALSAAGPFSFEPIVQKDVGTVTVHVQFINKTEASDVRFASGSITVTKKPATVQLSYPSPTKLPGYETYTLGNLNKLYGDPDPLIAPKVNGVVEGESLVYQVTIAPEVALPGTGTGTIMTRTVALVLNANSGANANYAITYLNYSGASTTESAGKTGSFATQPRPLGMSGNNLVEITYGDAIPDMEALLRPTGVLAADIALVGFYMTPLTKYIAPIGDGSYDYNKPIALPAETIKPGLYMDAGMYGIAYNVNNPGKPVGAAQNFRYKGTGGGLAYLVVNEKPVAITALDCKKTAGEEDPAFAATITDLAYDDTIAYTVVRTEAGEEPGEYALEVSVVNTDYPNYVIATLPGTLTIEKKADPPVEPEEPKEPVLPVEPVVPTEPVVPVEPTPTDPEKPVKPTPTDPVDTTPTDPVNPIPLDPIDPGTDTDTPDTPYTPDPDIGDGGGDGGGGGGEIDPILPQETIPDAPAATTIAPAETPLAPAPVRIDNPETPLAAVGGWSLVNVICAVAGIVIAGILGILYLINRARENQNQNARAETQSTAALRPSKRRFFGIVAGALGIVLLILVLLLENLTLPMIFVNQLTIVVLPLFILQLVALVLKKRTVQENVQQK